MCVLIYIKKILPCLKIIWYEDVKTSVVLINCRWSDQSPATGNVWYGKKSYQPELNSLNSESPASWPFNPSSLKLICICKHLSHFNKFEVRLYTKQDVLWQLPHIFIFKEDKNFNLCCRTFPGHKRLCKAPIQ